MSDANIYLGPSLEPSVRRPSPSGYWEALGPNLRMETAIHEAGHGWMAKMMGGTVRFLEIHPRQICVANFPREFELVQYSLAGWASEHLYHGQGERIPDRYELEEVLDAVRNDDNGIWDHGDSAHAFQDMIAARPQATDEQLIDLYVEEAEFCYQTLNLPWVWDRVRRVAARLCEREYLDGTEFDDLWRGR